MDDLRTSLYIFKHLYFIFIAIAPLAINKNFKALHCVDRVAAAVAEFCPKELTAATLPSL